MRPRLGGVHAELLGSGFVGNALGLYAVMIGSYLLPIATLVFLARLLGPQSWGSLAFMQAFAGLATLVVGYGFNFSATREVARFRLAELLGGVLGAKVVLAGVALVLAVSISFLLPQVREQENLLWPAMLWGLSVSFTMGWYYQGLEQMAFVARWETLARALSLAGILLLVRSAGDTWKVLVIQGVLLFGAVIVEMVFAYRNVAFRMPTPRLVWRTLRLGWSMFLFQGALSFYTIGNGFIVGLLASPVVVGYYVGGERIGKTLASLLYPITQALFPRISHLAARARGDAARLARTSLFVMVVAGCLMGLFIFAAAPSLVRFALGTGFEQAVLVLRILALLPPLMAVSNVLGIQWMLALGLDQLVNAVVFTACLLNVSLAIILVPHYLHVGMAVAVVSSEALVAFGLYAVLKQRHLDPVAVAAEADQHMVAPA